MSNNSNIANDLEDKLYEIKDLMRDVNELLDSIDDEQIKARAKSYWIPHILTAIDNDHSYMGGSMVTGMDTVNELMNNNE